MIDTLNLISSIDGLENVIKLHDNRLSAVFDDIRKGYVEYDDVLYSTTKYDRWSMRTVRDDCKDHERTEVCIDDICIVHLLGSFYPLIENVCLSDEQYDVIKRVLWENMIQLHALNSCQPRQLWNKEEYNKDYKRRDFIIFGNECCEPDDSNIRYFGEHGLGRWLRISDLELLVDEGFAKADMRHNFSPSIREFIDFAKRWGKGFHPTDSHPTFCFGGYATSIKRKDYRVSVDTIRGTCLDTDKDIRTAFNEFCKQYHADYHYNHKEGRGGLVEMYAWWD